MTTVVRRRQAEPAPVVAMPWVADPAVTAPGKGILAGRYFQGHQDVGYIGIDPSLAGCAIAVVAPGGEFHVWRLFPKSTTIERLDEIERWCECIFENIFLATTSTPAMCIEGYSFGSSTGREALGEGGGMVKLAWLRACRKFRRQPPSAAIGPQALKKFVTGSGGKEVKKQHMLLSTYKRWGIEFGDDNQCDAFGLAKLAQAWATGETETKAQAEVIAKLPPWSEVSTLGEEDDVASA